ncbi:FtsK/SpoIIIE domain-containing protein [Microtetraspora malaysiensis]|uniref:FtsK/SpoIIIE domain-containing protein n=1 Tax=Microtetraspora malaysiensis TaxID=161358 RepID=A0ABW6SKU1_9ACTN
MSRRTVTEPQVETVVRTSGDWWLTHGLPLATPPILCGVLGTLIALAHRFWGGDPIKTPIIAVIAFIVGAAVTSFAWMAAGRRKLLRILVVTSGVTATLFLVIGLVVGFGTIWLAYTACSLVVSVLWGIWRGTKYAGSSPGLDSTGASPLMDAIHAARVQFSQPTMDDRGVIRANVQTLPGGTLEEARGLVPLLSSDARAVPGGAHLARHPDKDGVGTIEIPTRDNLKGGVPWPGVTGIGGLPTDPFSIGEYQSGPCMVCVVGDATKDPRAPDIKHVKIGGVTGSGKSTLALAVLANLLVRRRVNVIGIDLSKELQTFGPVVHGLTWMITDEEVARPFLARLAKVIKGRTAHLAREGLRRWTLKSSLNLLIIYVEESKAFRRFQTQYENLVADSRSAGIMWISSTQDWIYRQVSTSVRKNHGVGICFGVEEADDAAHVLPDSVIAALGKNGLPTWGSTRPGYCYAGGGLGIPERMWPKMLRGYQPVDDREIIAAVDAGAPFRDPMDEVTAGLFGELFQRRTIYTGPVWGSDGASAPVTGPSTAPARPARDQVDDVDEPPADALEAEATAEDDNAADRDEMLRSLAESQRRHLGDHATAGDLAYVDPDAEISVDIDDPGEESPDEDQAPKPSPEEARRIWDQLLDELYRSGARRVETSDLTKWLARVQRERTFLYRQTDRWEQAGYVQPCPDDVSGWDLVASPLETAAPGPLHGE